MTYTFYSVRQKKHGWTADNVSSRLPCNIYFVVIEQQQSTILRKLLARFTPEIYSFDKYTEIYSLFYSWNIPIRLAKIREYQYLPGAENFIPDIEKNLIFINFRLNIDTIITCWRNSNIKNESQWF